MRCLYLYIDMTFELLISLNRLIFYESRINKEKNLFSHFERFRNISIFLKYFGKVKKYFEIFFPFRNLFPFGNIQTIPGIQEN